MLPLVGIAVVAAGFLVRLNPLAVVVLAGWVTGLAAGMGPVGAVAALGHAFNQNRYVTVVWLLLPVIGVLERQGLQERARTLIARIQAASAGRLLLAYFALRQITAALGLTALGGQAQMVRPMVAPMAEAAELAHTGALGEARAQQLRAHAAAADNVAVFFGEDIFVAMASVLLIKGVLDHAGAPVAPLQVSVWAIPTAVLALLVHGARLLRLDRRREASRA